MKTLICFGEDWGRHPSTFQFLARELSKRYRILWIESLGLRAPRLSTNDLRRMLKKLGQRFRRRGRPEQPCGNVLIYTPLVIPFHASRWAQTINIMILTRAVRRLLRNCSPSDAPILVTASPSTAYLVGRFGERRKVYYCADAYAELQGVDRHAVTKLEHRLLQSVDTVVATSQTLFDAKRNVAVPIRMLRHGVDLEHFAAAFQPSTEVAPLLRRFRRPVFGFHGLFQAIIDFELIEAVARRRPEWSFVFIGEPYGNFRPPATAPNVHYLPGQPYNAMPSFIKGFDVCMIPYKLGARTLATNPLKLREYLASGKPVISTHLPEVLIYDDVVRFASTVDEFILEAEQLLAEDSPDHGRKRMERVRSESWEVVAERFREILEESSDYLDSRPTKETVSR
jgi:glycosyltransferase involved in cell wall biosynthesis